MENIEMRSKLVMVTANTEKWQDWEVITKETNLLLQTFPEEIWLHIFDILGVPETLFNLAQATLFWKIILQRRKVEYLFPKVLQVLAQQNQISQKDIRSLLQMRLVCKSWKMGVNGLLERGPDSNKPQFQKYRLALYNDLAKPTSFNIFKLGKFKLVWSELQNARGKPLEFCEKNLLLFSPSNMFPGRRLVMDEEDLSLFFLSFFYEPAYITRYIREHRYVANQFLERVGHHFWHAWLDLRTELPGESWEDAICKCVSLLPNLKSLFIHYKMGDHPLGFSRVFPALRNLQLLSLENVPDNAVKAILESNPQVQVLSILDVKNYDLESFNLSALKSLVALSFSFKFATGSFSMPQMQKLRIFHMEFTFCGFVNWSAIFDALEHYKGTLKELHLIMPHASTPSQKDNILRSSMKKLKLPIVTKINIFVRNPCALDFLLGLHSLENLQITLSYSDTARDDSELKHTTIKFDPCVGLCQSKCNIWRLIPSLKSAHMTFYSSTFWGSSTTTKKYKRLNRNARTDSKCSLV